MPQNRRKVAFSAKQKKAQLQQKRSRKAGGPHGSEHEVGTSEVVSDPCMSTQSFDQDNVQVINEQPVLSSSKAKYNPNRYNLVFKKEKDAEVKSKLVKAAETLNFLPKEVLEVSYEDVFQPGTVLDMPKRPPWDHAMSKEILEAREEKYFREYVFNLEKEFKENLSHFDMNLETWRQLWRVIEFSDIVLLVTDIRHPVFHFSPALYDYVTKDLKKDMIVVFNKIDLVEPHVVVAWKDYFEKHFPKLKIMYFASYAGMKLRPGKHGKRIGKLHMAIKGARYLQKLCQEIVQDQVDLTSWSKKIQEEASEESKLIEETDADDDEEPCFNALKHAKITVSANDTSFYNEARFKDGVLTIGFVGHPNVGKSSFLNAVLGKKVVSVSRTPGHTKHYQTVMLTQSVRLCDCPGLVFPSLIPKAMQVLMGCYPIAQLRDPYSVMRFLCERLPIHEILKLQHPEFSPKQLHEVHEWSVLDVCEAFAKKHGYFLARSARPDIHRSANSILRMALDGRTVCLIFYPPGYFRNINIWLHNEEVKNVVAVQTPRETETEDEEPVAAAKTCAPEELESPSTDAESAEESSSDEEISSAVANKFDILANLS